jgi:methyl-accepting chemotaxis protein
MVENLLNSGDIESTTTISKAELADLRGRLAAIHEFQCIAEYTMDGKVITTNENYLKLIGYTATELEGQEIGMMLDLKYRHSANNAFFWDRLNNGECVSGKFKRIAKGVRTIWIQANYHPMMDLTGKPFKVVEFASDITEHVQLERTLTSIVEEIKEVVLAVKNNDLTQRIQLEGKTGEIATLCNDVNSLVDCMQAVISLISKTGDTIKAASVKVHAASKVIFQRCEKQVLSKNIE